MTLFVRNAIAGLTLLLSAGAALAAQTIEILSTSGCGCCIGWARHLERNDYQTDLKNLPMADLWQRKIGFGLTPELASCHTGLVDDYVIEGHVPAREITRLLAERPDAIGLTVPGMPYGSPGMGPENEAESYEVLLLRKDGSTEVFARYP